MCREKDTWACFRSWLSLRYHCPASSGPQTSGLCLPCRLRWLSGFPRCHLSPSLRWPGSPLVTGLLCVSLPCRSSSSCSKCMSAASPLWLSLACAFRLQLVVTLLRCLWSCNRAAHVTKGGCQRKVSRKLSSGRVDRKRRVKGVNSPSRTHFQWPKFFHRIPLPKGSDFFQ